MKRLLAFIMAFALTFSTFALAGCNLGSAGQMGDGDDVILNFSLYDLGYGTQWLDESCDRFMELVKDRKYGENNTGVFCRINKGKMDTVDAYADSGVHVYFDGGGFIPESANLGTMLNITDLITADVFEGEEYTSIEDRIWDENKEMFKGNDGNYYGLPTYLSTTGASYDKHLFDIKGLYYAKPGAEEVIEYTCKQLSGIVVDPNADEDADKYLTYYFVDPDSDTWEADKSCGPDGEFGTLDDGLPSSLYEFINLCDYMASEHGVQPMQLAGEYSSIYANVFMDGLVFSLLGEKADTTRSLTGEVEAVVGFSTEATSLATGNKNYKPLAPGLDYIIQPVTKTVNITEETGFYTQWSMERYYSMCMMEILKREGWMAQGSDPNTSPLTHLTAQKKFIFSGYRNMMGEQPYVGMLMESSYWYNESNIRGNLPDFYMYNPECEDREVRQMSLPVNIANSVTGEDKEGTVYGITESLKGKKNVIPQSASNQVVFNRRIEDNPVVYEAFKDWLYFFYSQDEIENVTLSQGMVRSFEFEMDPAKTTEWAGFYKHALALLNESTLILEASDCKTYTHGLKTLWGLGEGGQYWNCCFNFGHALMLGRHYAREGFVQMMWKPSDWLAYYKGTNASEVKYLTVGGQSVEYVAPWYDTV